MKNSIRKDILISTLSISLAILISSLFILLVGKSPIVAFSSLMKGSLGNLKNLANTLNKSIPLIIAGLAASVAFKAGLLNIGIEGQLHIAAIFGYIATVIIPASIPYPITILLVMLSSMVGGAIWGAITGVLRVRLRINEVIIAILLNYMAIHIASYMINYPFISSSRLPETEAIPEKFRLSNLIFGTQLNTSIFLMLILVVLIYILIFKTKLGYEIRAVGDNYFAAQAGGISVNKIIIIAMAISGLVAGVIGFTQMTGTYGKLFDGFSGGVGFTGLAVCFLAKSNPFVIIFTGLLFGILDSGARLMSIKAGLSPNMIIFIQGLVIFFIATPKLFDFIVRRKHNV